MTAPSRRLISSGSWRMRVPPASKRIALGRSAVCHRRHISRSGPLDPNPLELRHVQPAATHGERPRDRPHRQTQADQRRGAGPRPRRRRGHPLRRLQGEDPSRCPAPDRRQSHGQVRGRHRHHSNPARRGQDDHHGRAGPGSRCPRAQGDRLHPTAEHGPDVRDQGRRGRWRVQPGRPDGRVQPPSHRRHARHLGSAQSGGSSHRCSLVSRRALDHRGSRCPGVEASQHRPQPDQLASGGRCQRPGASPRRDRSGWGGRRSSPGERVRHLGRQRAHGHPRPCRWRRLPVGAAQSEGEGRPGRDGPVQGRCSDHSRRPGCRRRCDGSDEGHTSSQSDADPGGSARLCPCWALRQHRPRQLLDPRRPDGAPSRRLRGDRVRVRCRHGHGEVLRHQMPGVRSAARLRRHGGDGASPEDARWWAEGGGRSPAGQRLHRGEPATCFEPGWPT